MINLANHECLLRSNDIASICSPLKIIGISYFTLYRVYKDGYRSIYTNNPDWIHFYYLNSYYKNAGINLEKTPTEFVFWSTVKNINIMRQRDASLAANGFGIYQGVTLIAKEERYVDFYSFGATNDRADTEKWLIYNLDLLKRFIYYFRSTAVNILRQSEQNKIYVPNSKDFLILGTVVNPEDSKKAEFLRATQINKFYINDDVYLTKREIDCAKKMIIGSSIKETARELKLSPRTVEEYINNIKIKTGSNTKSCMIKSLLKIGINLVDLSE
jgi:DNA-binding CsgD family transcriptional regulator